MKSWARAVLPLAVRKRCAIWLDRQDWLPSGKWWAVQLVQDLAHKDVNAYHRFLWANHLGYAETYQPDQRFGSGNIHRSRRMLFDDLQRYLADSGIDPRRDVGSVFEVGSSLGYLLRHMETEVFTSARRLDGVDVDRQAILEGSEHLRTIGSRVQLRQGDVSDLAPILGGRTYDVIFCCGVLMYLRWETAARAVAAMLEHGRLVVMAGLAHAEHDNAELPDSALRERDGTFIHNIDRLVENAGGDVVFRRWEGGLDVDGNTIYFVFARASG